MRDDPEHKKQRALEFARRLRNRRVEMGMSQSDLAARINDYLPGRSFARASVSRYESGENIPVPRTMQAIAKVLNCEPNDLVPRFTASPRSPLSMEADQEGNVKLSIDTVVPLEVAMKIMALLPKRS